MTAQKGRSFGIKIDNGSGAFNLIGAARNVELAINNEPVDITNNDSEGIRELLGDAGTQSVSLTISGVYLDADANGQRRLEALAFSREIVAFEIVQPGSVNDGKYEGDFMVASLTKKGEYNGTMTYEAKLESSGPVTYTVAT